MGDRKIEIKKILNQTSIQTNRLHKLRKLLKIYYYNKTSLSLENEKQKISKKEALQELLGKWNDTEVIINQLQKKLKKNKIKTSQIEVFKSLIDKITNENTVLLEKIKTAIPDSELF